MLESRTAIRPLAVALAAAATILTAALAQAASATPTVTVRVEGESTTLLPRTSVTLSAPEPVSGCPANSVAAAMNDAVAGNWDHGEAFGGGGDFTEQILGETHEFTKESDTWAEWVNYKWGSGICSDLLSEGDEVLMVADHEPEPFFAPTVLPLVASEIPASVQVGTPFTVEVDAVHTPAGQFASPGNGTPAPEAGVTVSGGGLSALSHATGHATIQPTSVGVLTLRATKAGDAPSATFTVCVHNGNDGLCGTSGPKSSGVAGFREAQPYKGPYALVAAPSAPLDSHLYPRARAPRLLSGTILGHSAVTSVSIELRRSFHGRCFAFEATRARFVHAHCGTGGFFSVATGATYSYLLPEALPQGRYVLDVRASDVAGNQTSLARGSSRMVFYVG